MSLNWSSEQHRTYRRARRAAETPEQRERRLTLQRASYFRHRITGIIRNAAARGATLERPAVEILVGDPCAYCGDRPVGVDHIVPLVAGGGDEWENLTSACGPCNRRKREWPLLVFLLREAQRA